MVLLLFVSPFALGIANYFVPLQIGAPDMAFPRLNALGYWLTLFAGIVMLGGFATKDGAAKFGWYGYTPLSDGVRPDPMQGNLFQIESSAASQYHGLQFRLDRRLAQPVQKSAEGADQATQQQRLDLVPVDVLAERPNSVLVLPDCLHDPPPRASHEKEGHEGEDGDQAPADEVGPQLVAVEGDPPDAVFVVLVERTHGKEAGAELLQPVGAAEGVLQGWVQCTDDHDHEDQSGAG